MTFDCSDLVPTFKRGKNLSSLLSITPCRAFVNLLSVKTAKANDIRELLNHVNIPAEATFYDKIRGKDTALVDLLIYLEL